MNVRECEGVSCVCERVHTCAHAGRMVGKRTLRGSKRCTRGAGNRSDPQLFLVRGPSSPLILEAPSLSASRTYSEISYAHAAAPAPILELTALEMRAAICAPRFTVSSGQNQVVEGMRVLTLH